jgi:immune inhibitor A
MWLSMASSLLLIISLLAILLASSFQELRVKAQEGDPTAEVKPIADQNPPENSASQAQPAQIPLANSLPIPLEPASSPAGDPLPSTEIRQPTSAVFGGINAPIDTQKPDRDNELPQGKRIPSANNPALPADSEKPEPPQQPNPLNGPSQVGWSSLMSENFEGNFPSGAWQAFDNNGSNYGEFYWDDDDYLPHSGSWSAWAANGGANGADPALYYYPNNMDSWMMYGPFSLSSYSDAELLFSYWNDSELGWDKFSWLVSTNGTNFYGYAVSGYSSGWQSVNFDLTTVPSLGNVTGAANVWIAFNFTSDSTNVYDGAFVDDISLQGYQAGTAPNLVPYTPSGWSNPIVPSSASGTTTTGSLYNYQNTYIDWAAANNGGSTSTTFLSCLYFDTVVQQCWNTNGLNQNYYAYVLDYVLTLSPTAGAHTLKLVVDVNNTVAESNENDNTWQAAYNWAGPSQPNLVPYTPTGWSYPIVASSVTGTNVVNTLAVASPVYIDWAVTNTGASTTTLFSSCLYLDGGRLQCWNSTNGLNTNYYTYVTDWTLSVSPAAGTHTLKLVADVNNVIAEANETDNTREQTFTWGAGTNTCYSGSASLEEVIAPIAALNNLPASPGSKVPAAVNLMPPSPGLLRQLAQLGYSSADVYSLTSSRPAGVDKPRTIRTSVTGTRKALVLIAAFPDRKLAQVSQPSFYNNLLFSDGTYTAPGSMRDFYQANSYNQFDVQGTVANCALVAQNASYYGSNYGFSSYPTNAQGLVVQTVNAVDSAINFADYAINGEVDGLFVIHAGPGAEASNSANTIWSHSWGLGDTSRGSPGALTVDGVKVDAYTMEPEYIYSAGDSTIGVFAHEYGHFLGLPDLYDTSYSSRGVGVWSLMSGGSWNGVNGNSPASMDAWSKIRLGWITPTVISSNQTNVSIPAVNSTATVYKLWTNGSPQNEYFLLENRQKSGFDATLPGKGLLIWHVDDNKGSNSSACMKTNNWLCGANHYWVDLEQADGLMHLDKNVNSGDGSDPFPGGTSNRNFSFSSTPNSSSYANSNDTNIGVTNITESGSNIIANLSVNSGSNTLSITKSGAGGGTVTSDPAGISCGSSCSYAFPAGTNVMLSATASSGSVFTGWSGGCSGRPGNCQISLSAARQVIANFGLSPNFNKSTPANSAGNQTLSPTISWGSSSTASSYSYCISKINPCSNWANNGTATSKTLSGLSLNSTYYWNARATNSAGVITYPNGSQSNWAFTTGKLPIAFNKLSPANGLGNQAASVTLTWGLSTGAASYSYCYDTSNDNNCTNWRNNGTSTRVTISGLPARSTLYWQVRAINAFGTTHGNNSITSYWWFKTR